VADASPGVLSGTKISPFPPLRRHVPSVVTGSGGDLRRDWRILRANQPQTRSLLPQGLPMSENA
jgi:hypothetical protein